MRPVDSGYFNLFNQFRDSIMRVDPVYFCANYLIVDGKPLQLEGTGYKPFADIYRYIGLKAIEPGSKPVVLVKGRQVGATTMAAALECYFTACGLFGNNERPPMRLIHLFPTLSLAAAYTKDKLDPIVGQSKPVPGTVKSNGLPKSFMEFKFDSSNPSNNSMHFKKFLQGNQIWIESTGLDGDRIRGRRQSLETEFPTPTGFKKLKDLKEGDELFDDQGDVCKLTRLHPIEYQPEAYRITFDDGTTIDADAEHLWLTQTKKDNCTVKSTKEILNTLELKHSIPVVPYVKYQEKKLLIDPYVLGVWLCNGKLEQEAFNEIIERLKINKKQIPDVYMHSSYEQRLALVRGLIDTCGLVKEDGSYKFEHSDENLLLQIRELISSLGVKLQFFGNKHQIIFSTNKLDNDCKNDVTKEYRFIKSIEPIDSVPMRCITVDSSSHLYLVTRSFIPTHNTVDGAFFDECQDMPDIAIGAATKILTKSKYGTTGSGVQVYFGTPKTKGGSYWDMWQRSSQNYFHLRCEKCGKYFPLYRPDIRWEDVWVYGQTVKCTECGCEQDKLEAQERGKWIPLNDPEKSDFVGYHINQLYIPGFMRETIDKAKPERSPINTERIYMNEVLGEFYDGEGGTITTTEIREKCIDKGRLMQKYIMPEQGKRVYAGFDWGQKGALEQMLGRSKRGSYSCAVILTVEANIFNIEFATRLNKPDPEHKESTVEEMFRRYNMTLAVGDIGDAYDLTHRLQRTYDEKFLASRASHRVVGHVKYSKDEWPKTIVFEKDYYISEILGLLKEGRIKFPGGSLHRLEWLIEHCSSMDIKITKDKSGEPIKKYVKGSGANDGLMALLNAYLAWKFDVTQGFSISNPLHMKYELAQEGNPVQAVIGYIPRMNGRG